MGCTVHPLGNAIIAPTNLTHRTDIPFRAFATLPPLQTINGSVHPIRRAGVDVTFVDFVAQSLLEHMGTLS